MHMDYYHGVGYQDEDMDYEMPDPYHNMHMKHKRSTVVMYLCGFIACALVLGYPSLGLKMPQKDNPVQFRKKYGTTGSIQQMQVLAMAEYGNGMDGIVQDRNTLISPGGFHLVGQGLRIDLDSYKDLVC